MVSTEATSRARLKARAVLFSLYDFAGQHQRLAAIRLGAFVQLAADLGVSEMAVRSAAGRMVQEGWLVAERQGRGSVCAVTERARALIEGWQVRTAKPPDAWWNGTWCVVALSVPESSREVRDRMRKELSWLGFGSPSSALYISVRDHQAQVLRLAEELGASGYLQVYKAEAQWPSEARELVARAWSQLPEINRRYREFQSTFTPQFNRAKTRLEGGQITDREAFKLLMALVTQYRKCLFADPNLPLDLLPAAWGGLSARLLFGEFSALLTPLALRHFDGVCAGSVVDVEAQPDLRDESPRARRKGTAA